MTELAKSTYQAFPKTEEVLRYAFVTRPECKWDTLPALSIRNERSAKGG